MTELPAYLSGLIVAALAVAADAKPSANPFNDFDKRP